METTWILRGEASGNEDGDEISEIEFIDKGNWKQKHNSKRKRKRKYSGAEQAWDWWENFRRALEVNATMISREKK